MSTVVLFYCCHSDSASVLMYFTLCVISLSVGFAYQVEIQNETSDV